MKLLSRFFSLWLTVTVGMLCCTCQAPVDETSAPAVNEEISLVRSNPETHGISSSAISALIDSINASGIEFHSIMILRHDTVIAEGWWSPYKPEYIHTLYSLSKSFTSTAIGFAVKEGILSVDDKVVSFFPEDLPDTVDQKLADMDIKDLLTMSSGHESGTMPGMLPREDGNWPRGFLSQELTYEPGEHFMYNTGATYMLSAILQKKTGQTVLEFLRPRLFEPLGMEGMDWEEDPSGVNTGGYGLRVHTEDIAKLGLLYLHKGQFNGERLLPESWVEDATSAQITSYEGDGDWSQGYGYQFWRCVPENAYRGDGAFGQYCIVLPDQEMVIAITSESKDMQKSMNLLWDNLLPAVRENALPDDPEAQQALAGKLAGLKLNHGELGQDKSPEYDPAVMALQENDLGLQVIELDLDRQSVVLYGTDTLTFEFGWNNWALNEGRAQIPLGAKVDSYMAVRGGWDADGQFVIERQFVETAHHDRFRFDFSGNEPKVTWNESVSLWTEGNKGREIVLKQ